MSVDELSGSLLTSFDDALPPAPADAVVQAFTPSTLRDVRRLVAARARAFGLADDTVRDIVMAVNEIAANSVVHGGGRGILRLWTDGPTFIGEVSDAGWVHDALAGRRRPTVDQVGGRGLWMANQLCDLVQVRSSEAGTVVRMHVSPG